MSGLPICSTTGRIAGDPNACGDCDPCILGDPLVPDVVKRLIAERDEWADKYAGAMMNADALVAERDALLAAIDWACGEKPDRDGKWFGEHEPDINSKKRPYWWRTQLRALADRAALSHQQREEGNQDCCRECGEPFVSVPNSGDRGRCEPCRRTYG